MRVIHCTKAHRKSHFPSLFILSIHYFQIAANSGIALGTQPTPPLPVFMPPLSLLLPWVVKACTMPHYFENGRTKAYQLLCEMTIHHWHTAPTLLHLTHFYRLMHAALQPSSVSIMCSMLKCMVKKIVILKKMCFLVKVVNHSDLVF